MQNVRCKNCQRDYPWKIGASLPRFCECGKIFTEEESFIQSVVVAERNMPKINRPWKERTMLKLRLLRRDFMWFLKWKVFRGYWISHNGKDIYFGY